MPLLIDIHTHLDHCYFNDDLDKVIENAKKVGLKVILSSGINPDTNRKVLELQKKYDIVKASLGIYPVSALQKEVEIGEFPLKENIFDIDEEINFIRKNKGKFLALGEIGLDFFHVKDKNKEQIELFEKMIELAEELNKPVIIHSRKAEQKCVDLLESSNLKKIVLHCFCGKKKLVKRASDLGWYFTVPTNVVRSQQFQDMVKEVPITQLFCETDAPYLSPFQGKRNEPAFVIESYKKITEIKGMEFSEVVNNVWMNWERLF